MSSLSSQEIEEHEPGISLRSLLLIFASITIGTITAGVILPAWLPGLSASLLGEAPKAFWYLSRGSALVGYVILWLSMALGLVITNRMARVWPGGPTAFSLHEFTSLLGLALGFFHALILIGDQYIGYNLVQILMPFASTGYKPFWVGLGQIGFYVWAIVAGSFYVRKRIGQRTWRTLHFASFLTFMLVLVHGLFSGTDTAAAWGAGLYWVTGGSLLFLLVYRILVSRFGDNKPRQAAIPAGRRAS